MDKAGNVRKGEELNWANLKVYLNANLEFEGDLSFAQFHGGHANLTYLISTKDTEYVLRRPPFGKIAPGAHDMKREYHVLSRLHQHYNQAPRAYLYCDDVDIIGAPFVVMERKSGIVIRQAIPDEFVGLPNIQQRLTNALVTALADLHNLDISQTGLEGLGKPDGFVHRQVSGWQKRWQLSKTSENEDMESAMNILSESIPSPQRASIIHNDFKFDNCQFQPDNPDLVSAVFDWDMSTLGDPLIDFGSALSYWPDPYLKGFKALPLYSWTDLPDKEYLKKKYGELTGLNMEKIGWYESFSYWKNAVILQQLYKRYVDGETKDERMAQFGELAKMLAFASNRIAQDL